MPDQFLGSYTTGDEKGINNSKLYAAKKYGIVSQVEAMAAQGFEKMVKQKLL